MNERQDPAELQRMEQQAHVIEDPAKKEARAAIQLEAMRRVLDRLPKNVKRKIRQHENRGKSIVEIMKAAQERGAMVLLLAASMALTACDDRTKDGCAQQDWTCRHRYERTVGENVDGCINRKLDEMSDADHTTTWSASLLRELHRICEKLYPYGLDARSRP